MKPHVYGLAGLAIALLQPALALAVEPQAVATRLRTVFAVQGLDFAYAGATASGDDVTLTGVTVAPAGKPERVTIGDVTLQDVSEEDDGDFLIGALELPKYAYAQGPVDIALEGVSLTGWLLPSPQSTDPLAATGYFDTLEIAGIAATAAGKPFFQVKNLSYELTREDNGSAVEFTGAAESFSGDLSAAGDPQTLAMATALGLAKPSGSFETSGGWSIADGALKLDQFDVALDDAGTLGITFGLTGYTAELAKTLRDMQAKMANASEEEKSAQALAFLGVTQQLNFSGASIRYDDDGLTERGLNLAGGMQNMKRSDFAGLASMLLPGYLGQYLSPEFAAKVTGEVVKFINEPKSLEIVAAPTQPIPFAVIGAGAMMAPQGLPETLGVTVTANEAE